MAAITEDYVSFETAKLLKEKWFKYIKDKDELSQVYVHAYTEEGNEVWGCYSSNYYPCITLNMAMKWLREAHNIHIDICSVWDVTHWLYQVFVTTPRTAHNSYVDKLLYTSYEQAVEAAIKYCLENLIK